MELNHESERKYSEVHMIRGRSQLKSQEEDSKKGKGRSKSKTQGKGKKCYSCGKTKHFIKDCYAKTGKQKEEENVMTPYDPGEVSEVYSLLDSRIVGEDYVSVIPF